MKKRFVATTVAALTLANAAMLGTAASAEKETITFAYWNSPDSNSDLITNKIYEKVDEINANSDTLNVEVMYIPMDQYWAKIAALSAAGSMPDVMVFSPGQRCYDYASAGSLLDLTEYVSGTEWGDSFVSGAFSTTTMNDSIYAIPTYKTSACLFYNTELFEQAGITETPKTWSEFLDACEKLKIAGIQPIAMSAKDPDTWCTAMFTAYLVQRLGGVQPVYDIANRAEGYTFAQDCFIKAGEMTKELIDLGYIQPTCIADSNTQATTMVTNGEAAMLAQGSWAIASLENEETSAVAGKMGVFSFPVIEDGVGKNMWMSKYSVYAVGAQTEHPEAAVEFLQALTAEDMEKYYAEEGGVIPATQVEIDTEKCPVEFQFIMNELQNSEGDFEFFDEMLGTTIGNEWNSTLGAICAGTKTSEEAFEALQEYTVENTSDEE